MAQTSELPSTPSARSGAAQRGPALPGLLGAPPPAGVILGGEALPARQARGERQGCRAMERPSPALRTADSSRSPRASRDEEPSQKQAASSLLRRCGEGERREARAFPFGREIKALASPRGVGARPWNSNCLCVKIGPSPRAAFRAASALGGGQSFSQTLDTLFIICLFTVYFT